MADIEAYASAQEYMGYQKLRPDYTVAISTALSLAKKYAGKDAVLADFCCGTGSNTKEFAKLIGGLSKATLIDINAEFLEDAKKSGINAQELVIICEDILKAKLKKESELVLSIFAYHHVTDDAKERYVKQVKSALKKGGILILVEIYIPNKSLTLKYYEKLFDEIPKKIQGLKEFLEQTAKSSDFEFKVAKDFADKQFLKNGFTKIEEVKIWPKDKTFSEDVGTFVQIFRLD